MALYNEIENQGKMINLSFFSSSLYTAESKYKVINFISTADVIYVDPSLISVHLCLKRLVQNSNTIGINHRV